jgi:hypothetical protein
MKIVPMAQTKSHDQRTFQTETELKQRHTKSNICHILCRIEKEALQLLHRTTHKKLLHEIPTARLFLFTQAQGSQRSVHFPDQIKAQFSQKSLHFGTEGINSVSSTGTSPMVPHGFKCLIHLNQSNGPTWFQTTPGRR